MIYIETMVLFEVNKFKNTPKIKKKNTIRQNFIEDSDVTFIINKN